MIKGSCIACSVFGPLDEAHIKSRRNAGKKDGDFNKIHLCRLCHTAQHTVGWADFLAAYPWVGVHLREKGWEIEKVLGRFMMTHPRFREDGHEEHG